MLIVIVRDHWQGSETRFLPAELPIVGGHEPFGGGPRRKSLGPTEHRPHREVHVESARPDGGVQRSELDVELAGQLGEGQQLGLSRLMRNHRSSP